MRAGAYEGGGPRPPPPPSTRAPPERLRGASMGEALLILHLLAFPFLRSGTVGYLGGDSSSLAPPWEFQKYKIKRKLRLESNT